MRGCILWSHRCLRLTRNKSLLRLKGFRLGSKEVLSTHLLALGHLEEVQLAAVWEILTSLTHMEAGKGNETSSQ